MVASRTSPTGDLARYPAMCPDWESNWRPFGLQAGTRSTEPHQPGLESYFLKPSLKMPAFWLDGQSIYLSVSVAVFEFAISLFFLVPTCYRSPLISPPPEAMGPGGRASLPVHPAPQAHPPSLGQVSRLRPPAAHLRGEGRWGQPGVCLGWPCGLGLPRPAFSTVSPAPQPAPTSAPGWQVCGLVFSGLFGPRLFTTLSLRPPHASLQLAGRDTSRPWQQALSSWEQLCPPGSRSERGGVRDVWRLVVLEPWEGDLGAFSVPAPGSLALPGLMRPGRGWRESFFLERCGAWFCEAQRERIMGASEEAPTPPEPGGRGLRGQGLLVTHREPPCGQAWEEGWGCRAWVSPSQQVEGGGRKLLLAM